jgi:hypothetical protein
MVVVVALALMSASCGDNDNSENGAPPEPTPRATATPSVTTEPTATATPSVTEPTATATPSVTEPTATATPVGEACPVAAEVVGIAGDAKVLDTGWTGLAHRQSVIPDGKLTFTMGCDSAVRPCGVCNVGGPIQNANAGNGDIDAHRCSNDTSIKCNDDGGCTAPGTCVFYFGAPLPLSAGGVSTCVTNQINGNVSGTANVETGAFASSINLTARVFGGIENAVPCPVCVGDGPVNDGIAGGTCSGGPNNGLPCDGNGRSPLPSFGTTSLDCPPPPGALYTALAIGLNGSSGTETNNEAQCQNPTACPGGDCVRAKCFCPANGETTKPNACLDDREIPGDGTLCEADSATKGHCQDGPFDSFCQIENFRGCSNNQECPAPGDSCVAGPRACYLDNGLVGGSVIAIGMADPPTNGQANPTLAALFCVGKTNPAVNAAAGLPGLGRIELPLSTKEILTLP